MKNFWQRTGGPPSKSGGGYFLQHAVTLKSQEQRNESSSSTSDSSDSESSYKTSSQISPPNQNYKFRYDKPCKYNPLCKNKDFLASSQSTEKDDDLIGHGVIHPHIRRENPRNICARINVPELVKYFDGLEIFDGQILTGRTMKEKSWETTNKNRPDQNPTYGQGKNNNDHHAAIPPNRDHTYSKPPDTRDHTYSKPPKSEDSDKTFVNSNPRTLTRDDFFDVERFRNVCTFRRRRIDELKKGSLMTGEQRGTDGSKEPPVATRVDNAGDNITTRRPNRNNPFKKYTSIVGPMPHNYRPVVDIAPNEHFTTTRKDVNNDSRMHYNQSVPNLRYSNKYESNPKTSNITPRPTGVIGGTYFHPRDRGDQMAHQPKDFAFTGDRGDQIGSHHQQRDYRQTSAYLDNQAKYARRRENCRCPFTDQSGGLYSQPSSHIGPRDCKNNLITRPNTVPRNDHLSRDVDPKEDNRQDSKKGRDQNLTYDIASEDCSNSLCLSRKGKEPQSQETETETSTKVSASKFSINQSQSSPRVLSIRIDINLSHPNLFLAGGAKSLDLKKRKMERENP